MLPELCEVGMKLKARLFGQTEYVDVVVEVVKTYDEMCRENLRGRIGVRVLSTSALEFIPGADVLGETE